MKKLPQSPKPEHTTPRLKVTIGQLLAAEQALQTLARAPIPGLVAFKIARLISRLQPEMIAAQQGRLKFFEKFGSSDGQQWTVTADKMAAFTEAIAPYFDCEVDVEASPLPLDTLEGALQHVASLTPELATTLIPFVEQENK